MQAAQADLNRGIRNVPIPFGKKFPALKNWPQFSASIDELPKYFASGKINIGRILDSLVDIDLDSAEAIAAAIAFLPPTGEIHGRPGKPSSHRWYRTIGEKIQYKKFSDTADTRDNCLLEIRHGAGLETVIPPSHHPSGEQLAWEAYGNPAEIKSSELFRNSSMTASCALLARHWAPRGQRQDFALALAGFFVRHGLGEEEAGLLVKTAAVIAGDEEAEKRADAVAATAKKLRQNVPVTGGKTLSLFLDNKILTRLTDWLNPKTSSIYIDGKTGRYSTPPSCAVPTSPVHPCTPVQSSSVSDPLHLLEEGELRIKEENENAHHAPSLKNGPEIDPMGPLPRHKKNEWFLRGPILFSWFTAAGKLPGKAFHVGMMLWLYAYLKDQRQLHFPLSRMEPMDLDRYSAGRGLKNLEMAGLISLNRESGQSYVVTILDAPKGSALRPRKRSENVDENEGFERERA